MLVFRASGFPVAGDTTLKVWDLLGGARLVHEFSHHQKTITSLCLDSSSSRLMSASLDHMIKFYDVSTYNVVHSTKYPEPILSMQLSPDSTKLAVGQVNGQLIVRRRDPVKVLRACLQRLPLDAS
jgi:U3 small nucleolar RNA-associated protein 15